MSGLLHQHVAVDGPETRTEYRPQFGATIARSHTHSAKQRELHKPVNATVRSRVMALTRASSDG